MGDVQIWLTGISHPCSYILSALALLETTCPRRCDYRREEGPGTPIAL